MTHKKIVSIAELMKLSKDKPLNCYIALMGGACRSSKNVYYNSKQRTFSVINEIDGTEDILTKKELYTDCNIGEAIDKGAFYLYD